MGSSISARGLVGVALGAILLTSVVGATPTAASRAAAPRVTLNDCFSTDNGDPEMTGFSLSPTTVDVTGGDQTVQIRVEANDTGGPGPATGVTEVRINAGADRSGLRLQADLRRGSDGAWTGALTIGSGTSPGPWSVYLVTVNDGAGLSRQYLEEDMDRRGFGHVFTVVGPVERVGPLLEDLVVTPALVDARHGPARLTVTARATDDLAGVSRVAVSVGSTSGLTKAVTLRRVGSSTDWTGTLTFGKWDTPGRWLVTLVELEDRATWPLRLDRHELSELHLPGTFTVQSKSDRARPQAITSSISPRTVDARTGDGFVTLQAHVSDARSGVAGVSVSLPSRSTPNRWPAATQFVKVLGTARDGVWRARVYFPHCDAGNGTGYQAFMRVIDRAGNSRGFASPHFRIRSNNTEGPELKPVTYNAQPRSGPVVFVWRGDVTGIREKTALVRLEGYDRFNADEPPPAFPGSWRCLNVRNAHVSCATGHVRTAQFTPDARLPGKSEFSVEFNPEHTMSVMSFDGHPEITANVHTRR